MKVFIIESPNAKDLLDERNETESIISVCKMFEHQIADFFVKSKNELCETINYINGIDIEENDYIIFHFSCHGNEDGLAFGNDFLTWNDFIIAIKTLFTNSKLADKYSFIISACGANKQKISKTFTKVASKIETNIFPPKFIITFNTDIVNWQDAILCWTILYHQLIDAQNISRKEIQQIMKKLKSVEFGDLKYSRWEKDERKYKMKQYS